MMKRKYVFIGIGIFLIFTLVFLVFLRDYQPKQIIHSLNLDVYGKSPFVKNIGIIQQNGARPRFSPDGKLIVFDRKNEDGFYDVYLMTPDRKIVQSLAEDKTEISQRHNGNADFHPSGDYIVFISEEENHAYNFLQWPGDPGLGTYTNLWVTNTQGTQFWKLTDIPIKKHVWNGTPDMATVNPHFSTDGSKLFWTERYDRGGRNKWGKWRIKSADFVVEDNRPRLDNERIVFIAEEVCPTCNYVTSMGFVDEQTLVLAGNLSGQHEYGMDQYLFNLETKELTNLQNLPLVWEEDASISPGMNRIVYMSNVTSRYALDFDDLKWAS